jgi:hypothetical protein
MNEEGSVFCKGNEKRRAHPNNNKYKLKKQTELKKKKIYTISASFSSASSLLSASEAQYDEPSRRRRRSPRVMYKLGGRGGGRGGGGSGTKRPPAPHGRGRGASPSIGSGALPPRGRAAAAAAAAAAQEEGSEESFSLESSGPPAFAALIRLTPDLIDEIRRAEEAGGGARIMFNSDINPLENVSSLSPSVVGFCSFESVSKFNLTDFDVLPITIILTASTSFCFFFNYTTVPEFGAG